MYMCLFIMEIKYFRQIYCFSELRNILIITRRLPNHNEATDFKQCTNVTDILKICMYLSADENYNVDKITAVSYLETFVRSGCYRMDF